MESKFTRGGLEISLQDLKILSRVSPAQLREMILDSRVTSGPGIDIRFMPTERELDSLLEMAQYAINRGNLICFGHWPNTMIKANAKRSGGLYNQSALAHPFMSPYIIMHEWSDANTKITPEITTAIYLINPLPDNKNETCISFEAVSLEPMEIVGVKMLGVGDRVYFDGPLAKGTEGYAASIIPVAWRFGNDPSLMRYYTEIVGTDNVQEAACCNLLDPIVNALAILGTRGIKQETIKPDTKLAKARTKAGKPPIPSYRVVDSNAYVTAITARATGERHGLDDGKRSSPMVHIRRGHIRHYTSGQKTFIADTLIAADEATRAQFKSNRTHYTVKDE